MNRQNKKSHEKFNNFSDSSDLTINSNSEENESEHETKYLVRTLLRIIIWSHKKEY